MGVNNKQITTNTALMFEPVRGGTRGGQAEFSWSDVSQDKDREVSMIVMYICTPCIYCVTQHYLGHSINAPTGRWQRSRDVHWYSRRRQMTDAEREEEIRKIKELEANALSAALYVPLYFKITRSLRNPSRGFESTPKNTVQTSGTGSDHEEEKEKLEGDERKRKKAEKKEQRRAKKEARRLRRDKYESGEEDSRHHRLRSPHRHSTHDRNRDYHSHRGHRQSSSPSSRRKGV